MIDSNNIEIIRDNLKELDQKIENLDVEIPPHTSGDAGKYLGVNNSGGLEFSNPFPSYSETEIYTGETFNGKKIYSKYFSGKTPDNETNFIDLIVGAEKLINITGYVLSTTNVQSPFIRQMGAYLTTGNLRIPKSGTAQYLDTDFEIVVFYTKPDPAPEPETLTKKKKSK